VVDTRGQVVPELAFATVLDPAESDLARLDARALERWFGEATVTRDETNGGRAPRVPLWTWLICTAALAFFLEGALLRK
jgi:hypothetical protein